MRQQKKEEGAYVARVEVAGAVIDVSCRLKEKRPNCCILIFTLVSQFYYCSPNTQNGIGGSLFSNDGGVLTLDKLIISKVTAAGLVSTSNRGITMMESSMISRSTIDVSSNIFQSLLAVHSNQKVLLLTLLLTFNRLLRLSQWEVS